MSSETDIAFAASAWRSGYSLPQSLYTAEEVYQRDVDLLGQSQWLLIDHEGRIPKRGDYFVTEWGSESIIVVRDTGNVVRAFYNVCRHRGSRVCLDHAGSTKAFRCPYHSWVYDLDGKLRAANHMADDFDRAGAGLHPCHVNVAHGLIFLNLSKGNPPEFRPFISPTLPFLVPHGTGRAKVAARRRYPTAANWKLCVENFYECYHCRSAHRTYCSIHDNLKLLAFGAGAGSAEEKLAEQYAGTLRAWEAQTAAKGYLTGMFADGPESAYFQSANRLPIGQDSKTETVDGKPIAKLMGDFDQYDGGQTGITFNIVNTILLNNDHAIIFRFIPVGPLSTDIEAIWLVDRAAEEGRDYEVDRLMELWDITLAEDKTITENNQLGVLSRAYEPGRYSQQEQRIAEFGAWYVAKLIACLSQGQSPDGDVARVHARVS